ncbi:MAG: hypothetical protein RIB60_06530 [Phycisphaerales bacterium]
MKTAILAITAAAFAAGTTTASAQTYIFEWEAGDTAVNNAGGEFQSVTGSYNATTNLFTWDITFADQITDGYTLAVSPGDNPKGTSGELALIYFDASNIATPEVTVYAYNGQNTQLSWADGSDAPGVQSPDKIVSSSGINSADILSATVTDGGGMRTLSLEMDATNIQNHLPKWPGSADWTGLGFADSIGVWLHPTAGLTTEYGVDGFLNNWTPGREGWLDGSNFHTVPAPAGSLALGGLGLAAARRRR